MKDVSVEITDQHVRKFSNGPLGYVRLNNEANTYKQLKGLSSIPRVIDVAQTTDTITLVMEHVKGQSLRQLLDIQDQYTSRPIPWSRAKKHIQYYVAAEMSFLHANALYRDLNLDHIIFTNQKAVILDLESTIIGKNDTWTLRDTRGTWETMAPEEFMGYGTLTARTATYRAAIIAHQILTGQLPFKRFPHSRASTHAWRKRHPAEISSLLDTPTRRVFGAALARNPTQRYKNPARFLEELAKVIS